MPYLTRLILSVFCSSTALAAPSIAAGADEGEKVFQESCTPCHNAKQKPLDAKRLTREKWKEAVERMEGMGAEIPSGKKLEALLDYLERTHGSVGRAPAGEK